MKTIASILLFTALAVPALAAPESTGIQLGPRPYFLVDELNDGALKARLNSEECRNGPFRRSDFSIGHRGAPLQFPEHTRESYEAAARMGAGIVECDVTFTKDRELVCRHAQNDLHTTTDILLVPELAAKCSTPFTPATFDAGGKRLSPANAECRTSDITLAEFRRLRGKMDAFDPDARTPQEYVGGTAGWRTDLYAGVSSGTLMSHRDSIALFTKLGVKMTPELKSPVVSMPFEGFTQQAFAQQLIDEYKHAGVPPAQVFAQSFVLEDVLYWLRAEPAFGRQAVFLDDANVPAELPAKADLQSLAKQGVRIWAPAIWALIASDKGVLVPSRSALDAKAAGLELIAWSFERSGHLADGQADFYYQSVPDVLAARRNEGVALEALDVIGRQLGARGVFSDWPASVTYYANCMGL